MIRKSSRKGEEVGRTDSYAEQEEGGRRAKAREDARIFGATRSSIQPPARRVWRGARSEIKLVDALNKLKFSCCVLVVVLDVLRDSGNGVKGYRAGIGGEHRSCFFFGDDTTFIPYKPTETTCGQQVYLVSALADLRMLAHILNSFADSSAQVSLM